MKTVIVSSIKSSEEKNHLKGSYTSGHRAGNKAEKKEVGKKQFDWLNKQVRKLPKGQFAATHTKRGNVHISQEFLNIIPKALQPKVKRQLRIHEKAEHKSMSKR